MVLWRIHMEERSPKNARIQVPRVSTKIEVEAHKPPYVTTLLFAMHEVEGLLYRSQASMAG